MKICIIVAGFRFLGGHAVQARDIIEHFEKEKIEIGLIPVNPELRGIWGHLQKYKYIRTVITEIAYIRNLIREIPKYDVLHIFSASYWSFVLAPVPAVLIGRHLKKKIILNYRSGELEDHLAKSGNFVKKILKNVDIVVISSFYLQRIFNKFGIDSMVIPNMIDQAEFSFKKRDIFKPNFIVTRSLEPLYNISCVLKSFKLIQERYPDARLTVVGNGSQEKYLKSLVLALELENITFIGRVEHGEIAKYYADADIMLNASNVDNVPISILEALSSGIPVVSTGAGGIPDIIKNGETGILVPLNDEKAIAEKAIYLLENQDIAKGIAEKARDYCRQYHSWNSVRQKWLDVYGD